MIKRFFILLLATVASVGMSYALTPLSGDAWDESTKTLTVNANPGKNAYKDNTEIEHVIINNGVTSIGNAAFYGCSSLTSVTLPSGLTTIGNDAFRETSLASVSLPSGLISIGNNAFNQCTSLASVTFPEGLETIGIGAFSGCPSLTSVTLPESLTTVNVGVFSGCTSLASVTILAPSLSTYGQSVFYDTASGLKIYVPAASVDTYKAGWSTYADKIEAIPGGGGSAPTVTWNSSNVSNLTVNGSSYSKEGVTLAPNANDNYAYWLDYGNESQNGIYFYVNSTGGHTFSNSLGKNFTKIEMTLNGSNGWYVAYLGSGWNIDGMKVIWTGNASTVDLLTETSSFGGAAGVKSIVFYFEGGSEPAPANSCGGGLTWELSEGVLTISYDGEGTGEMYDFGYEYDENPVNVAPWKENKSEITTVIVGDGVKSIGNHAFNDLSENFTAVTIANSVERIGLNAFLNSEEITEITLPSSLKTIDEQGFANCGFTSITIPSGVTSIGYKAFCYCKALTSLTCEATTPPTLASSVFYKIRSSTSSISSIPLYVPSESVAAYQDANQWNAFNVQAIPGGGSTDVIPCTAEDLGKVLCTDGSIYATVSEAAAASKTAAAVIAYVDTQNGKALALALADESGTMDWAPAKTTAAAHTPAVSGGTWKLPTKDEWNNMITAAGGYTALRDGFSAVGGTNMQQDKYWSSTPENDYAWCYYFNYGKWIDGYVDNPCYVRACLEFDIPAAPAYETVMNLINEIPNPAVLTAECKAKIDAARTAYDALSAADKDLVTNYETLTTAEAAFENVMNIWLSGDCDVILWNDTTMTVRKHAGEGNGAMADYNYASRAPWYSAHWYDPKPNDIVIKSVTIEEGVTHLGDYAFAWMSEMKTLTIPSSVTTIPEDAFFWSQAVDDIYLHTNPSDLMWVLPTSADNQFKPEKATLCHVPVDLLPAYQGWLNGLNVTYVGDQTPTIPTLEVGLTLNAMDVFYLGPDTTCFQFNCFSSNRYFFGKGSFRIKFETPAENVHTMLFQPKQQGTDVMMMYRDGETFVTYGTNCCATALPTSATVTAGDGTKANPFVLEPDTKGECVQAEWTTLPQAVSEITYDGQPHTLVAAGVSTAGTVQYSLNNGANWSAELPQGTDPVTYTIHYRVIGGNACIQGIDYDPNNKVTASIVAPAVENVEAKIAAIPQPVVYTPACNDAIAEARSAYDALDDELKPFVENDDVLTAAEATYNNMKYVSAVEAKINNIPTPVTLTLATRDSIESARAAYDALTADQKALVPAAEYQKLLDAEAALAEKNPGGGMPADALNGKFTINADGDQIAFAKGNLQATTTDLGANWTWGFAANQWNCLMIVVANSKINGNGTVSENGTVDLFGWSTAATYYGINNSDNAVDYPGDFVDWGPNMGAGWRTLTKDEWNYLIENNTKGRATVNDKNGYIFLPNDWSGPAFTPDPNNFTTNVYSGDDWTAMENAGAVFLPCGPARNRNSALVANDVKYYSSTSLNNDSSYVFTIYYNQSQSACTVTSRAYGCMVRLVTEGSVTPLDSAQHVKDLIDAILTPVEYPTSGAAIEAALNAFNELSDAAKGALDDATVQKLNKAITDYTALIQAGADKVVAKINNIPLPVELKLATRDSIESARAAYDALTADQKALVPDAEYQKLLDAEAALAEKNPGGGAPLPEGALNGKFTINADGDQIAFSKGNLQATTEDLGEHWTWGFAANQWEVIGDAAANNAVNGNRTVSANGTVDLFGWSTLTTYYGIHNSTNSDYYSGDFKEWGENITGATWKTLSPSDWIYIISNRADAAQKQGPATVNGVNGYIFLPDEWELPSGLSFTAKPNNWTANVYDGDDWTAMENAGAVFLPKSSWRKGNTVTPLAYGYYWSSDYNNYSNAMAYYFKEDLTITGTGIPRYAGIYVRLVTADAGSPSPLDSAQHVKDLIEAIPVPVTLNDSDAIQAARAGYDALSNATKGALDYADVQKLTDAEDAYAALIKEATDVIALINAIPQQVVYNEACGVAITAARNAYDALDDSLKPLVSNYSTLTDAETAYSTLKDGVDDAIAKIDAIPSPVEYTDACKDAIDAARNAYDALNNDQKAAISTAELQKLTDAEAAYAAQKKAAEDQAAADAVVNKINAIGEVEYSNICKNNIEAARAAYDALTDDQKARVTAAQLQVLTDAEAAYAALAAQYEHNVTYLDNDDATLQTEMVALVNFPEAPEVNGFEFVRWDIVPSNLLEQGVIIQGVYASLITLNPVAYDTLVYNGAAQTLIVAGQSKVGHLEYRIGEGAWSATLPQAKDAGAYDVIYKLVQDGKPDYIAPDTIKLSIAKTPLVVTADDKEVIFGDEAPANSVSYTGFFGTDDASVLTGNVAYACNYIVGSSVGEYAITPSGTLDALNYTISYAAGKLTVKPAPLTITAENKSVIYGDAAPQFTVVYSGWKVQDSESVLLTPVQYTTAYVIGSSVGVYDIQPHSATAQNYDITFVNGTLTVNKAHVYVSGAEAHKAKFADGHAIADVTKQGILNGIKLNDPIAHVTTAAFSSADVAENLDITLFYELTGDAALLNNYYLDPTSDIFTHEGVIIEPFLPDNDDAPEDEEATVEEGIEVYAYGYCDGEDYKLKYHLNSGYPNQYKIEFEDSRFTNVDWTPLTTAGRDGTIDINIPVDLPTGDYTMTVTFRDSRFDWLESNPFNVTFHVNLPETYVVVLLDNTIALIDTCHCLTDVQWYHRNDASELWQPIEGATDRYYFENGGLTGEYFVKAKMNGVDTYTCPQTDVETLYDGGKKMAVVVRAYPSPAIDRVEVSIENSDVLTHMMTIVNMMGSEIEKRMFNGNKTTLDVSGYQSGNYMISVDGNVVKVIKK